MTDVRCPACGTRCTLEPLSLRQGYRLTDKEDGGSHALVCLSLEEPKPGRYRRIVPLIVGQPAWRDLCRNGHPLIAANCRIGRYGKHCRACEAAWRRKYRRRVA